MKRFIVATSKVLIPYSIRIPAKRWVKRLRADLTLRAPLYSFKRPKVAIITHPEDPRANNFRYTLLFLAKQLGYQVNPKSKTESAIHVFWEDSTWTEECSRLSENAVNYRCLDISKQKVNLVFEKVFGYSVALDPRAHQGEMVEKSDLNGLHDGRVIHGPITNPREGCVYQRFVDTRVDDTFVDQLRVPIFDGDIPLVLIKYKLITAPFASSMHGSWEETSDQFSDDEIHLIQKFCKEIGLDYGELDVLRDRGDGRIYIVDANKTPTIHFAGYKGEDARKIIRRMAKSFQQAFEQKAVGPGSAD